jgi:deoxyribose-phosphate aldolase
MQEPFSFCGFHRSRLKVLVRINMSDSTYAYSDIAKMIDHSLLNPALTVAELETGCQLARQYDVASVCILPYYAARCAEILAGSTVVVTTAVGFPHGGHKTSVHR